MSLHKINEARPRLRADHRVLKKFPIGLRFQTQENQTMTIPGFTLSVHRGGVSCCLDEHIPKGIKQVTLEINNEAMSFSLDGQIVWAKEDVKQYGVKFTRAGQSWIRFIKSAPESEELSSHRHVDRRKQIQPISFEDRRFLERRRPNADIDKTTIIPRYSSDYDAKAIGSRLHWLEKRTQKDFALFKSYGHDPELFVKNVENCIGVTHVPLGLAGPLQVNGKYANGSFYIPMATNQGTLVDAYHRGALIATMSGGVNSVAYKDGVHLTPSFVFKDLHQSLKFASWARANETRIREVAERTSRYAKLVRVSPFLMGRMALLNCLFKTGDASGLNMINIACDAICKFIADELSPERYFLRSNFSSDKKPSYFNFIFGYGKEVMAELTLGQKLINRFMRTTAEDMYAFWYQAFIASMQAGMMGANAHFANGLAAMYMATGQDIAQIVNAATGIMTMEVLPGGDLRIYCKFPQLIVATVGGGTSLPYPRAALELMGCYGEGKVLKLAEIMAATCLAGEVSICGALASGEFAQADLALRNRKK